MGEKTSMWKKAGYIFIIVYSFVLLTVACLAPLLYDEIDSNALPVISLQYRGSLTCNLSDILQAKIDFPTLYANVNGYEDLRNSKLVVIEENKWLAYYFPVYPLLCIPVKVLFSWLGVNQERTFSVTNVLLLVGALTFLYAKLKAKTSQKLAAVLLLMASPAIYYIRYVNYEVFIYSALIVAMTLYHNGNRNWSAFCVSIAAMANSTVAAIGLVMIAEYAVEVLWKTRRQNIILTVKQYWKSTAQYAVCFLPCLSPFAEQMYYLHGKEIFGSVGTTSDLIPRLLTYLFDPTLGFTLFAPLQVVAFFVVATVAVSKKKWHAVTWLGMLLGVVAAYSLMPHINCGMKFSARYVAWSYALIPIFLVIYGYDFISRERAFCCVSGILLASSVGLIMVNPIQESSFVYSNSAQQLLKYLPGLYNQYVPTFYSRTLNKDGCYNITDPAYYADKRTDQIYKMVYKADPGQKERVLKEISGDELSVAYLTEQLNRHGEDGKYHYINFPVWGKYKLHVLNPIERGELMVGEQVAQMENVTISPAGNVNGVQMPLVIKPNTEYFIELVFSESFDPDQYSNYFVDFYSADGYDYSEQESGKFAVKGRYRYEFFWNSGDFEGETKEVFARFITTPGELVQIERFTVDELISVQ